MKNDVVPRKFECQEDRKRTVPPSEIATTLKKRRHELVAERLDPVPSTSSAFTAVQEGAQESNRSVSDEPLKKDMECRYI